MVYVVQRDMTFDLSNTINPKYKRDVIRFYSFSPCTQGTEMWADGCVSRTFPLTRTCPFNSASSCAMYPLSAKHNSGTLSLVHPLCPSLSAASPPSFSPLPCPGSPRCCPPCCSFSCRARAGDISPRSAGAPSLRSSLLGSSSRWSAATRRTLCRCSSEPSSASTTRRTASRCGECRLFRRGGKLSQ